MDNQQAQKAMKFVYSWMRWMDAEEAKKFMTAMITRKREIVLEQWDVLYSKLFENIKEAVGVFSGMEVKAINEKEE